MIFNFRSLDVKVEVNEDTIHQIANSKYITNAKREDNEELVQFLLQSKRFYANRDELRDDFRESNEWEVTYLLHDEDNSRTERGFAGEKEARNWARGENLEERCDEIEFNKVS